MKKTITTIFLIIATLPLSAQPTTPFSLRERSGVRLLSLSQLKDSALHNNVAIRNAYHDIDAAQEQRKEAFTKYFPNVSGTGLWVNTNKGMAKMDINIADNISPEMAATLAQMLPPQMLASLANPLTMTMMKNGVVAGVNAIQPVFAGGQIINGNKLAKVGEDVSKLQLQLSEDEVEKTTEQYFWQLVTLKEKMKTIHAVEELLNGINNDVTVAVKAGVAMRNDLLQVQLRQNEMESQKIKLQNGIAILKLLLAQHCGLRDSTFDVSYNPEVTVPLNMKQDPQQALLQTTEYQLLNKQVEATQLQRKITIGENLPTVAVGAGYNYHTLMDNNHSFGMVFATVSVPISNWWGGSHAIKRKKIDQQKAIDQLNDNSELLKIRMQKAWNDVDESYQQLTIAQKSINQAEENLRLNRNFYQAGTSTMSDLLQAQLLYQQAHDKHTDAFAEYQIKLLEYRQAIGK